ncbi:MAG TPA: ribosomal L7Ae/L30e/S12e/Gadd45 family protein [archaeon]|nr:ribosomal L7Ae/L30e/S12e/Gadd45 family protein [archaeon]
MAAEKELKEALKAKRVIMGSNSVIRGLKAGLFKSVVYASNAPENSIKSLEHYTQLGNTSLERFEGNSKQLGEICGKPFNILLVGLKK